MAEDAATGNEHGKESEHVGTKEVTQAFQHAAEGEEVRVYDGIPLLEEAGQLKDKANACVKKGKAQEAVKLYEEALAVLAKCVGYPMLKEESVQVKALKAVLHGNLAQCMLNLQLYRRAIEAATSCLELDAENLKALHRRSLAHEHLKDYEEALHDAVQLKKLGGGALGPQEAEKRCEKLYEKLIEENKYVNQVAKDNEDMLKMKERFDVVLEKYDLGDGEAAPQVAAWLVEDGDFPKTVARVKKQWDMTEKEAKDFARWIKKGLELKIIPTPKAKPET